MAIKFEHDGKVFEADTPEQAISLLDLLERRAAEKGLAPSQQSAVIADSSAAENPEVRWDLALFSRFIRRLGEPQKLILQYMILGGPANDWELRHVIGVSDNQALAGVLSGIAKQAIAEKIPPRAVFAVENFRSGGKRSSRYALSGGFLAVTRLAEWPSLTEQLTELPPKVQIIMENPE